MGEADAVPSDTVEDGRIITAGMVPVDATSLLAAAVGKTTELNAEMMSLAAEEAVG